MIQLYGEDAYINERQYDYDDGTYLVLDMSVEWLG